MEQPDPFVPNKLCIYHRGLLWYTIPLSGSMFVLSFFQFFSMCKMLIYSMYVIWKNFPPPSIHPVTHILHIPFCISDTTRILLIPPMNITHTTQKNWWYRINLNRQILHIDFFYYTEIPPPPPHPSSPEISIGLRGIRGPCCPTDWIYR
jgi:hypothetical protein